MAKPNINTGRNLVFKDKDWINSVKSDITRTYIENNFNANTLLHNFVNASKREISSTLKEIISEIKGGNNREIALFSSALINKNDFKLSDKIKVFASSLIKDRTHNNCNFSDQQSIYQAFQEIKSGPVTVILDETLEESEYPTFFLRNLRAKLKNNPKNRAVIIACNNPNKNKPPISPSHFREWNTNQLCCFLKSAGFIIEKVRESSNTTIVELSANEADHRKLLSSYNLPSPKNSMIITTEHADTVSTGGIGSYIKEVELITGTAKPIVLTVTPKPFTSIMVTKEIAENIIDIHDIIKDAKTTEHSTEWKSTSIDVYRAFQKLSFLYDQLHIVEYQEYQGIGARIAQAKKSGEIYPDITCVVRCHGSQVYIERASKSWANIHSADILELERFSINLSDEISFPTSYLKKLYDSTGYEIPESQSYVLRLPYSYPDSSPLKYQPVEEIIFIGKRSKMKGYPDFCEMVLSVTNPANELYNKNISKVNVIAAPGDASAPFDSKLKKILESRNIDITIGPLPRHQVLATISKSAPKAVVCLPYGGDNHPVTILEMISNRCRFVAYENGGIPELIPSKFHGSFLCSPDFNEMAKKLNNFSELSSKKTGEILSNLHDGAISDQLKINKSVSDSYSRNPSVPKNITDSEHFSTLVSVMVPIYNTDLRYVSELIESIKSQSVTPKEVIFINDCSTEAVYVKKLHKLIDDELNAEHRIIDLETNRGLAGARNVGLKNCTTKYLINIDSDDIIGNNFILDYVKFMENNPNYSACACALESFTDDGGYNIRPVPAKYTYVGLGNCFILGISKNIFGHAGSCVVVDDARKIDGWDESDRSKWEDWAFFLKMSGHGMKIFNFPKSNYFYRINPTSMARTYANYPAEMRIARNIFGLSTWESQRLFAYIGAKKDKAIGGDELNETDTLTYKIAKRITQNINRIPIIKKILKKAIILSWATLKKSKDLIKKK